MFTVSLDGPTEDLGARQTKRTKEKEKGLAGAEEL